MIDSLFFRLIDYTFSLNLKNIQLQFSLETSKNNPKDIPFLFIWNRKAPKSHILISRKQRKNN